MNSIEWAKKEVEMACELENPDRKEGEFDYGCACYESALKAFESLMDDNHSGMSFDITKNILIKLMNGIPLTPIEDVPDVWNFIYEDEYDRTKVYQCKRRSSLFKYIKENGDIEYKDNDCYYAFNLETKCTYNSGFIRKIVQSLYPITFPYIPKRRYRVETVDFLTDKRNGDFDTIGVFTILVDGVKEDINKFFKWDDWCDKYWVEITKEEFEERKNMRL